MKGVKLLKVWINYNKFLNNQIQSLNRNKFKFR